MCVYKDINATDLTKKEALDNLNLLTYEALTDISEVRKYAKDHDLLDTQEYINFEDKLNEVSVMDPNK